jgi:hypothetical protein
MSILKAVPTPLHRDQYPGELAIFLGGGRSGDSQPWTPAGWNIALQHADCTKGAVDAGRHGKYRLIVKNNEPVMLALDTHELSVPDLATFTGKELARELSGHMRSLLADFAAEVGYARCSVRFCDLGQYNDMISSLAGRYLGTPRNLVLRDLLNDVEHAVEPQMAWYRSHGPSKPGETSGDYEAEVAAFVSLTEAYRIATIDQMTA